MIEWFKMIISPPVFEGDDEKTRNARFLSIILFVGAASAVLYFILMALTRTDSILRPGFLSLFVFLLICVLFYILKRGFLRSASLFLTLGLFAVMIYAAVTAGGVISPWFFGLIVVILIAGMLFGSRVGIAIAILGFLSGILIAVAKANGLLPESAVTHSDTGFLIIQFFIFSISAIILHLVTSRHEQMVQMTEGHAAALQESEEHYRSVVEDSPGYICRFIQGGEITFMNEVYSKFFGKKPEEMVGKNFFPFIAQEDRERVMMNIQSLSLESPTIKNDQKVITPGGEIRWQRWTNRALFDKEGQITGYQSFGEDITEQLLAETALQENEERMKLIIDGAETLTWEWDMEQNIFFVNQHFIDFFRDSQTDANISFDEMMEITHPDDIDLFQQNLDAHLSGKIPMLQTELRMVTESGEWKWVQFLGDAPLH